MSGVLNNRQKRRWGSPDRDWLGNSPGDFRNCGERSGDCGLHCNGTSDPQGSGQNSEDGNNLSSRRNSPQNGGQSSRRGSGESSSENSLARNGQSNPDHSCGDYPGTREGTFGKAT